MICDVILVRERGYALPRWRSCMHAPVRADLSVVDEMDHASRRYSRVARLHDPVTHAPLEHPPLYDATLLCIGSDYMTLTGIERIVDPMQQREHAYAQTWLITPVTEERR